MSDYYSDLLGPNFKEGKPIDTELSDSNIETLKAIVDFCYTGNINLTKDNIENVLHVASLIVCDLLVAECEKFLSKKLSDENCRQFLIIANKYDCESVRKEAINMICEFFENVPLEDIQKLDNILLLDLLNHAEMKSNGDLCAIHLLNWFGFDEVERSKYMPELLKAVQLKQVSAEVCITSDLIIPTLTKLILIIFC